MEVFLSRGDKSTDEKDDNVDLLPAADTAVEQVLASHELVKEQMVALQKVVEAQDEQMKALTDVRDRLLKNINELTSKNSNSSTGDTHTCQHQKENTHLNEKMKRIHNELKQQQKANESLKKENVDLNEKLRTKDSEFDSLKKENVDLNKKLRTKDSEFDSLKKENVDLNQKLRTKDNEFDSLKKENVDLNEKMKRIHNELKQQQKANEWKTQECVKLQQCCRDNGNEIEILQQKTKELYQELNKNNKAHTLETEGLKGELNRIRQRNNNHELKIRQLTEDKYSLERQVGEYRNEIQQLEGKLRHATQRKVVVSLYCGAHQIIQEAYSEMVDMLTNHMETQGIQIQVDRCSDPQSHPITSPLLVLCINASRLGTDVQQAISNVKCDKSVSVVVLHHKECHALPSQASDKILVGSQYRQLGAIVDVAFLKSKGMYPCDMNEKALNRLTDFLSQFVKQGES